MKKKFIILLLFLPIFLTFLSLFWIQKQTAIPRYGNFYPYLNLGFPSPFVEVQKAIDTNEFYLSFIFVSFLYDLLFWAIMIALSFILYKVILFLLRVLKWFFVSTGRIGIGLSSLGIIFLVSYILMYKFYVVRNLQSCTFPPLKSSFCSLLNDYNKKVCFANIGQIHNLPLPYGTYSLPYSLRNKKNEGFDLFYVNNPSYVSGTTAVQKKLSEERFYRNNNNWLIQIHKPLFPTVYCLPLKENLNSLLKVKDKESAYDYFVIIKKLIERNFGFTNEIKSNDDFFNFARNNCQNKKWGEPEYTTVEDMGDMKINNIYQIFQINYIFSQSVGNKGIYKKVYEINPLSGEINLIFEKTLLDCGRGSILY